LSLQQRVPSTPARVAALSFWGHWMPKPKDDPTSEVAIELEAGGEVWHRVATFADSSPDDRHFVLTMDESGTTTVRFGDGAHGARLPAGTDEIVAAYRRSQRFVTVVRQQGRVVLDNDWRENLPSDRMYGTYRAMVVNNDDPTGQSRVQVEIAGVSGNTWAWAMPCRPVGSFTLPAVGASVWISFEAGDPSRPVWMGVG
jgi:hypothetical protein